MVVIRVSRIPPSLTGMLRALGHGAQQVPPRPNRLAVSVCELYWFPRRWNEAVTRHSGPRGIRFDGSAESSVRDLSFLPQQDVFVGNGDSLSMATEICTLLAIENCTHRGSPREGSVATATGAPAAAREMGTVTFSLVSLTCCARCGCCPTRGVAVPIGAF